MPPSVARAVPRYETAGPPSPEARAALNEMHQAWGHTVGCAVMVIETRGFLGIAVRSAIAGMSILAPKHFRVRVTDTVQSAAPWLAEQHARSTGVHFSADELYTVLSAARLRGAPQLK